MGGRKREKEKEKRKRPVVWIGVISGGLALHVGRYPIYAQI